jgi:glucoamylase
MLETITTTDINVWADQARKIAIQKALNNVSPADGQPGAVLASPSTSEPNYYYHWVRDSARAMRTFVALSSGGPDKGKYDPIIRQYVSFSMINQFTPNVINSLGEPKFMVSGLDFTGNWGRPQNDGPAERATALTRWAFRLLNDGQEAYVQNTLYDGYLPSYSTIKADLEFVAHHWWETCVDLWEETNGTHFYTRMQQRTALREGAKLASVLNDQGAADFYNQQASIIESQIEWFWDAGNNRLKTTIDWVSGVNKPSNLDVAIILGSIQGYSEIAPFYLPTHDRVLATAWAIHEAFLNLYQINSINKTENGDPIFPGIGRYPEDTYIGTADRTQLANPWFICTCAMSSLCYKAAELYQDATSLTINEQNINFLTLAVNLTKNKFTLQLGDVLDVAKLKVLVAGLNALGDAYLRRVQLHAGSDGSLSEQFDKNTGTMVSARDLTWSYIALVVNVDWKEDSKIDSAG